MGDKENVNMEYFELMRKGKEADAIYQSLSGLQNLIGVLSKKHSDQLSSLIEKAKSDLISTISGFGGLSKVDEALSAAGYRQIRTIAGLDLSWLPQDLK